MGSKDPFNFDDIYKEAGVDNLFVKKSMAEQKAMAKPMPTTPPRPQPQQQHSPGLATSPGGLSQLQRPPVSTAPVRTPMTGGSSSSSKPSSSSNLAGLDDPFAGLGGISKPPPMAAQKTPVRAATPPRAPEQQHVVSPPVVPQPAPQPVPVTPAKSPAAAPAAHAAHAFDLEDMFGLGGGSSSNKQQQHSKPAPATAPHHDDPFAAFGGVEGASAAIPATQPPPPAAAPAAAASPQADRGVQPTKQEASATYAGGSTTSSSSRRQEEAAPLPSADSYGTQQQQRHRHHQEQQQRQQQQQQFEVPEASLRQAAAYRSSGREEAPPGSFSGLAAERAYGVDVADAGYDRGEMYGSGPDSFSGAASTSKGWGGLLKSVTKTAATLGKKGLKAAQAGLAQLETAIDGLDKQGSGKLHSADSTSRASANGGAHQHHQHQQEAQYDDVPAERVLSMAIHISELPSNRQEDALARLPRPVRQKVLALLREQAVIEGEEQLSTSGSGAAGVPGGSTGFIPTREFKLEEAAAERPRSAPSADRASAAAAPPAASTATPAAAVPAVSRPPVAAAPAVEEEDLLGLHGPPAAGAAAPAKRVDRLVSVSGIDDFFSGGAPPAGSSSTAAAAATSSRGSSSSTPQRPHTAGASGGAAAGGAGAAAGFGGRMSGSEGHLADLLGGGGAAAAAAPVSRPAAGDLMGGLEVLHVDVDVTGHAELYADGDGGDDDGQEPAIRRQLRAARAAEKHAKMKAALAEKQAKEVEEATRREQQQQHKQAHRDRIDAWKNKNKGNVRGLLGSLQTVLWEDSGWQPINMGDLLEPTQVRKAWMKANLLVHPDKVRQRSGSDEQVAIADMIFDALKEAWGQFRG